MSGCPQSPPRPSGVPECPRHGGTPTSGCPRPTSGCGGTPTSRCPRSPPRPSPGGLPSVLGMVGPPHLGVPTASLTWGVPEHPQRGGTPTSGCGGTPTSGCPHPHRVLLLGGSPVSSAWWDPHVQVSPCPLRSSPGGFLIVLSVVGPPHLGVPHPDCIRHLGDSPVSSVWWDPHICVSPSPSHPSPGGVLSILITLGSSTSRCGGTPTSGCPHRVPHLGGSPASSVWWDPHVQVSPSLSRPSPGGFSSILITLGTPASGCGGTPTSECGGIPTSGCPHPHPVPHLGGFPSILGVVGPPRPGFPHPIPLLGAPLGGSSSRVGPQCAGGTPASGRGPWAEGASPRPRCSQGDSAPLSASLLADWLEVHRLSPAALESLQRDLQLGSPMLLADDLPDP